VKPGVGLRRGAAAVSIAFVADMALGSRMVVWGVRPDLTLAVLAPVSLLIGRASVAWLGLLAGALQGSFASVAFGSLSVSRSVAAWGVGMLEERLFRDSLAVAAAAGFASALGADVLFFVFAPQPYPAEYAYMAVGRALYNMALAVPIWAALRPVFPRSV